MNAVRKSVVEKYHPDSVEYSIVEDICSTHDKLLNGSKSKADNWQTYQDVLINVNGISFANQLNCDENLQSI